jgi:parallel beta-helix repeat protein
VPADCDRWVQPSADDRETVQTMFEEAQDGETLCLLPGTYRFDDPIELRGRTGIRLRGTGASRADVILDFRDQGSSNDGLAASNMRDLTLENFTVLDATHNNIYVSGGTGVTIRNVSSGWVTRPLERRGTYAIYPVESTNVLIEDVEAFGSSDAGIYVGQTTNCIVRNSVAHGNVAGIEIENSRNCEVHHNEAYENTAGILVFELPGLAMRGSRTSVHHNVVRDNDTENFAQGGIVALVPSGIGIMILAANEVEVRDNQIRGNDSMGIAVVSFPTAQVLGAPMPMDSGYDPFIDAVWIHDNTYADNGQEPHSPVHVIPMLREPPGTTMEDILFDGIFGPMSENDLCLDATGTFREARSDVMPVFSVQSTDRRPYTCTGTSIPPVMF